MMEFFEKAVSQPWPYISFAVVTGAVYFFRWIGNKFFDDERGVLTGENGIVNSFLTGIREDTKELKETILGGQSQAQTGINKVGQEVREILGENTVALAKLERQLILALQAKPEDDELFNVLFGMMPVPICYINSEHRFTNANFACQEFFETSLGELTQLTFDHFTMGDELPADIDNVQRVESGSLDRYRMDKRYQVNGKEKPATLYVFRYPNNGAFLHFISIIIPKHH